MKTRYILYPLLIVLAMLLPTSCSFEEDIMDVAATSNGDKVTFTMGVSIPGASNVESRAFGETDFNNIKSLHIAVFEVTTVTNNDGTVQEVSSYYKEFLDEDDITLISKTEEVTDESGETDETESNVCWNFNVTITKADGADNKKYRLHLIANYPGLTMEFGEESKLMGVLETEGNNKDVYWNFVELNSINENTSLLHVPLVRNYAQVELSTSATITNATSGATFKPTRYALYNVPTRGRVAAYNTKPDAPKFANFVNGTYPDYECHDYNHMLTDQKYEGNEAYDNGDGTFLSTTDWKDTNVKSYMYERNHSQRVNPTCMIIEGTYKADQNSDGVTCYYKLDFVDDGGKYYNLLRNFKYTMTINGILGPGYDSPSAALKHPAGNNISGDTKTATFTNISDGIGQLYVSTTSILFTQDEQTVYLYYKYIPNINNPSPTDEGVNISGHSGGTVLDEMVEEGEETMGQYTGWYRLKLTPKAIPPTSKEQILTFETSSGLKRTVTLTSQEPYTGMTVVAYDGENNPLNKEDDVINMEKGKKVMVDINLPAGIPESLFPLRLFIRSAGNTIFPQYDSNMPAESQNGKYGFIKEVSYDVYDQSTDKIFTCEFLTNCVDNGTTVYVENQYLATAKDKIYNTWTKQLTINATTSVNIERIWGRYPEAIYGTNGNNGTKSGVKVLLDNNEVGTITIDYNSVINNGGCTIVSDKYLSKTDEVVFEFTDNYWHGQWSTTPITYRATAKLGDVQNTTLNFKAVGEIKSPTSITLTLADFSGGVSVEQESYSLQSYGMMGTTTTTYNVYPYNIHNGTNYNGQPNNNGEESVDVYYNNEIKFKMTINNSQVTNLMNASGTSINEVTITDSNGLHELEFVFEDQYCTGLESDFWGNVTDYNFSGTDNKAEYKAVLDVKDLLDGGKLNFTRQQ